MSCQWPFVRQNNESQEIPLLHVGTSSTIETVSRSTFEQLTLNLENRLSDKKRIIDHLSLMPIGAAVVCMLTGLQSVFSRNINSIWIMVAVIAFGIFSLAPMAAAAYYYGTTVEIYFEGCRLVKKFCKSWEDFQNNFKTATEELFDDFKRLSEASWFVHSIQHQLMNEEEKQLFQENALLKEVMEITLRPIGSNSFASEIKAAFTRVLEKGIETKII